MKPSVKNKILSRLKDILFWIILLIPYILLGIGYYLHYQLVKDIPETIMVIVNKENLSLTVIDYKGYIMATYPISVGMNFGNKAEKGDLKTPEGIFQVIAIDDSRNWSYDFENDNQPSIKGAFGPYFIRLGTEFKGIGIHGTNNPAGISLRATHGCIRLRNSDLVKLVKYVKVGTNVIITPSKSDL